MRLLLSPSGTRCHLLFDLDVELKFSEIDECGLDLHVLVLADRQQAVGAVDERLHRVHVHVRVVSDRLQRRLRHHHSRRVLQGDDLGRRWRLESISHRI